ncbi:MAG: hypothetical protein A2Y10_04035 [Planctomycetes bacterium GWF2_41_51]|nr:MAG: hypothetical protein A2Y10_04035 [Planctomycetes bacterium GWF2_41_51]HBG26184.1 hypothetical protein [Phycisphaerales bacterium]
MKTHDIQGMYSGLPLFRKIQLIQAFIEDCHFCDNGIAYSMLYDGTYGDIGIWKREYFEGQSVGPYDACGWMNNENSTFFSGMYLQSQVYRYQVTGDSQALEECRRGFNSIRKISDLAGKERFGWLSKPFGMQCSNTSSPDQNLNAINGMLAFLPYASAEEVNWIHQIIPAIARCWHKMNYTIEFDGRRWDMRSDIGHMKIFYAFNEVAHKITDGIEFQNEANQLLKKYDDINENSASLFDTHAQRYPDYFSDWRLVTEFAGATALFASQTVQILAHVHNDRASKYLAGLQRAIQHSLIGFNKDYYAHYYMTEVKNFCGKYIWRPLNLEWRCNPVIADHIKKSTCALSEYPHRIYWFDATSRIPLIYLMYLNLGGCRLPYIEQIVLEIMGRLDFARLHWMVDRDGDQFIPELTYMHYTLTSEMPNYIAAYWLGKKFSLWD